MPAAIKTLERQFAMQQIILRLKSKTNQWLETVSVKILGIISVANQYSWKWVHQTESSDNHGPDNWRSTVMCVLGPGKWLSEAWKSPGRNYISGKVHGLWRYFGPEPSCHFHSKFEFSFPLNRKTPNLQNFSWDYLLWGITCSHMKAWKSYLYYSVHVVCWFSRSIEKSQVDVILCQLRLRNSVTGRV